MKTVSRLVFGVLYRTVFSVTVVASAAAGLALHTEAGTRFAIRLAVDEYDDLIPGQISLGRISGRLASGLSLFDLRLASADGRPLVTVDRIDIDMPPFALALDRAYLHRLSVFEPTLHLYSEATPFADLAPASPAPSSAPESPTLPVPLLANLEVDGFVLIHHDGREDAIWVENTRLSGTLDGRGSEARLRVARLVGASPKLDLGVRNLSMTSRWRDAVIDLRALTIDSTWGTLEAPRLVFDPRELDSDISLTAVVDSDRLRRWAGARFDGALADTLEGGLKGALRGRGSPEGMSATLTLTSSTGAAVTVGITGSVRPSLDLHATIEVADLSLPPRGAAPVGGLSGQGTLDIAGADLPTAEIRAAFQCDRCRISEARRFDARVDARLKGGTGRVAATLKLVGIEAAGTLRTRRWDIDTLALTAEVPDVARTARGVAGLLRPADLPPLSGRLTASARCDTPATRALRCEGRLRGALETPWVKAPSLSVEIAAEPRNPRLPFQGKLILPRARIGKDRFGPVTVSAAGDRHRISVTADARRRGERLRTKFDVTPTLPMAVDLAALKLRYRDLVVRLRRPASLRISAEDLVVGDLDLDLAGGNVTVNGVLSRRGKNRMSATLARIDLARLARLFPGTGLTGEINGKANIKGEAAALESALRLSIDGLQYQSEAIGDLRIDADYKKDVLSWTLNAEGGVARRTRASARLFLPLTALSGGRIAATHDVKDLRVEVEGLRLSRLARLIPELSMEGVADLTVEGAGSLVAPHGSGMIHGRSLAWNGIAIGDLSAQLALDDGRAFLRLKGNGPLVRELDARAHVPIVLRWPAPVPRLSNDLRLAVTARDVDVGRVSRLLADRLSPVPPNAAMPQGLVDIDATLEGLEARGYVIARALKWRAHTWGDIRVGITGDRHTVSVHGQWRENENRFADLKAVIPIEIDPARGPAWRADGDHSLALRFAGVDHALLSPFLDAPADTHFWTRGEVNGEGSLRRFELAGRWRGALSHGGLPPVSIQGRVTADQNAQTVEITAGLPMKPFVTATLATRLPRQLDSVGGLDWRTLPLDGKVAVNRMDLGKVTGALPAALYQAKGTLNGTLTAWGTFGNPRLGGRLTLEDGAVTVAALNQRIRDIGFTLRASNTEARIDGVAFRSGAGRGTGELTLNWERPDQIIGTGRFHLKGFPVVRPGLPEGLIDSRIEARLTSGEEVTEIDLVARGPRIRVLSTSPSRVPATIRRVRNVRFTQKTAPPKAEAAPGATRRQTIRLSLDLDDPVEIRGQGVDMRWQGSAAVEVTDGAGTVEGGILALPGRFELLGNQFQIESGALTFSKEGSLDPFIDITARTTTPEAEVWVTVRGRVSRPRLELSSDPAMSQYQIVSLLITGRSDTADKGSDESVQSQAAALLVGFNNPRLERQLYSKLGIDRVGVSMGGSAEPIVVVGKRLNRKVYVETEYHHNAPKDENSKSGRVQYNITPGWSVETAYGDAQKGEVGIFWQKRFDSEDPKRAKRRKRRRQDDPP